METTKPWYYSKTVWFGLITMLTAGLTASLEETANWQTIALAVVGAAGVALRTVTTMKITAK